MSEQKRIRDYGVEIGILPTGPLNKITDVPGVSVGHATVKENGSCTGITIIMPCEENPFLKKPVAACFVHNGFGKTAGMAQIEELGTIETPIALTNTLNVGLVHDAMVDYMIRRCREEFFMISSVNPIIGETNDSRINRITNRVLGRKEFYAAIGNLQRDFPEGDIGAGSGTVCHGLKGGIGSASRVITIGEKNYTIGVLVQSNYGTTYDFTINGVPAGRKILQAMEDSEHYPLLAVSEEDRGSIMIIVATDLPVNERQLKRIIRRCGNGLARLGSITGHGSGDVMIGFTTANCRPEDGEETVYCEQVLKEYYLNDAFRAAAECTEEAVLNSMITAETVVGRDGRIYYSLKEFADLLFSDIMEKEWL